MISLLGLTLTRKAVAAHYSTPEAPLTEDVSPIHVLMVQLALLATGCYYVMWMFWGS